MRRLAIALVSLVAMAVTAASPAFGESAQDERLQRVVDGLTGDLFVGANLLGTRQAFMVPGAVLTVSRPGRPARTYVSGVQDVGGGIAMRADARQPVGSGTKPMVGVVVLRLVQAGRLRLDATVCAVAARHRRDGGRLARLARRFAGRLRGVTVRELLAMTSGLADYDDSPAFGRALRTHPRARRSLARQAAYGLAQRPLFRPGARRRTYYSNTNYALLGMIAEAVSGRTTAQSLRRVFVLAGMRHSRYGRASLAVHGYQPAYPPGTSLPPVLEALAPAPLVTLARPAADVLTVSAPGAERGPTITIRPATPGVRQRYAAGPDHPLQDVGASYDVVGVGGTAGAVTSTAPDLARFWRALFEGRLADRATMRQLRRPVPAPPNARGVRNFYGLGVQRQDVSRDVLWPGAPALRIWMKLGDIFGYTSAAYYVEGAPFDGVVVTNTTNLFPSPVGDLGVLRETLHALS